MMAKSFRVHRHNDIGLLAPDPIRKFVLHLFPNMIEVQVVAPNIAAPVSGAQKDIHAPGLGYVIARRRKGQRIILQNGPAVTEFTGKRENVRRVSHLWEKES